MRISNFSVFNYNLSAHKERIADIQREIEQGGISYKGFDGVRNTLAKLETDDNVSMLSSQIKSLESIKNNMDIYDNVLQSMRKETDNIKDLLIKRENDSLTPEGITEINNQMLEIVKTIESLEQEKLNSNEDLFGYNTELVVGNNHRMTRSFDESLIQINDESISQNLKNIINRTGSVDIKDVQNKIDLSLVQVGSNTNSASSQISLKELHRANEIKFFEKLQHPEQKITELNSAIRTYEASMLMISKVQNLGLQNYL